MDTTVPALPPNAAKETGGNLDKVTAFNTQVLTDMLGRILLELQITNQLLAEGLGVRTFDAAAARVDPTFPT
jgi:hypothetical protein